MCCQSNLVLTGKTQQHHSHRSGISCKFWFCSHGLTKREGALIKQSKENIRQQENADKSAVQPFFIMHICVEVRQETGRFHWQVPVDRKKKINYLGCQEAQ